MTTILAHHRRKAQQNTFTMTRAQQSVVELMLALDPLAQQHPDLAHQIAADAGFPVKAPRPGLAELLDREKRGKP